LYPNQHFKLFKDSLITLKQKQTLNFSAFIKNEYKNSEPYQI
jgi:hypothetical protein